MRPSYSQLKESVLIEPASLIVESLPYYNDINQQYISGLHTNMEVELNDWNVSLDNNINTNVITANHTFKIDGTESNMKYYLVVITPQTNTAMNIDINKGLRIELSRPSTKYIYDITNYLISGENYIDTAYLNCQLTCHNLQNFKVERIFSESYILKASTKF